MGIEWEKKEEEWMPPVDGVITSYCGERENPILHKQEIHDGVDIAVAEGTEVRAVKSGTVTEVRTSDTYGNLMKYETEDGYEVMYAHLSKVMVKEGEKIKQGQIVAKSGNTGLSTGPHLHYGIYQKGKLVDPLPFLSADAMV
ncbi:MAG: M23 family metallopeptidase [Anaerotignum sp.]|nr:M23 family metallopeptidase [Anaerotignum sp.]